MANRFNAFDEESARNSRHNGSSSHPPIDRMSQMERQKRNQGMEFSQNVFDNITGDTPMETNFNYQELPHSGNF